MNKKIIIQIPFNIQCFNPANEINEEWIKYRLRIFADFTLKGLITQTNQYFTALFRCRDETISFIKKEIGNSFPKNILIVGINEYKEQIMELIKDYDYLYLVRLDSDDIYIKTFIDTLQNHPTKIGTEILINQNLYRYDINQKRLVSYFNISPSSYCEIYKTEEYTKGKRYYLKGGHEGAILLKHELISGINYLVTIHEKNNQSIFAIASIFKEWEEIEKEDEIKEILKEFGLEGEN